MEQSGAIRHRSWTRQFMLVFAFFSFLILCYFILGVLALIPESSQIPNESLALLLLSFFIPTLAGWFAFPWVSVVGFGPLSGVFSLLAAWVAQSVSFLLFIPAQVLLCYLLFFLDRKRNAEVIVRNVEIEQIINEKNDMELAFKEKGTNISVLFEKYTRYYSLRNLATEFSTTLSLKELSQTIVSKTTELIQQGDRTLLFLAEPSVGALSLIASKSAADEKRIRDKAGSLFDLWVLRNRQSLIVTDTQKDFRFDSAKISDVEEVRSLIAAPLVHEGKMAGTLRLSSAEPNRFTTDDLRFLDVVATLASSALSNSILFQKTEELAIRDSLTGLYLRRYFLERLREEHGRSLLTQASLTLLMCDLDHFKQCNDRYGHGVGDFVLTKTAEVLRQKASDGIAARYGGEEFAVLLPKVSLSEGVILAETIRKAVSEMNLMIRREIVPVTISLGAAAIPADTLDSEELIRIADQRLYHAKNYGRNQVCGKN
jgi:diguanylate cyclase (GGDEF)-like protein